MRELFFEQVMAIIKEVNGSSQVDSLYWQESEEGIRGDIRILMDLYAQEVQDENAYCNP